ncbi:MAG: ChbG/HpnK family deacetylase [Lachnospiraceae bacterium]|nr:ChbG/HpnK family deacetylase [Lachnospiraceae bacterium]
MKKMVVRADDVGYTDVANIGTFETIYNGVVTSADVMLDTPGTIDALKRLKELPWISIGWHAHFWGSPVLGADQVPSLVIPGTDRFRHDLLSAADFDYDELIAECRAQMERCISVLGKAPDTTSTMPKGSLISRAVDQICEEYGIAIRFASKKEQSGMDLPDAKWEERKIFIADPFNAYKALQTNSVDEVENYDPASYYIDDPDHLMEIGDDVIVEQSWHPGYLDYYMYREGDYGPRANRFTLGRILDVEALCSDRLKNWIRENQIELINFRDALYGTQEYQNHLRQAKSDLYMG